jgi:drug/metabolite transporter (DMT)-like permease
MSSLQTGKSDMDGAAPAADAAGSRDVTPPISRSANIRAGQIMILAIVVYGLTLTTVKAAGDRLPTTQIFFVTEIIPTIMLGVFLATRRSQILEFRAMDLLKTVIPGLFATAQLFTLLVAIRHLPLAEVTALGFSEVIFLTLAAALILKETVRWEHWVGAVGGFVGVLVILRPTGEALNIFAAIAILSALFDCAMRVSIRKTGEIKTTATVVAFYTVLVQSVACSVPAILSWVSPTPFEWLMLVLCGILSALLTYLMTIAYRLGEASVLAPLDFIRLVIVAAFGYVFFREVPDVWMFVGGVIVVLATTFAVSRGNDEQRASTGELAS